MMKVSSENEIGLNINIKSFFLPDYILNDNDSVCITIIALPEQKTYKYALQEKILYSTNYSLSLNISKQTKKIIIDFKKQNFLSDDHTIAFTMINQNEFPKISENYDQFNSDPITTDIKTLNLYASIHQMQQQQENKQQEDHEDKEKVENYTYRKVIGNMKIILTFSSPYNNIEQPDDNKVNNKLDFAKVFRPKTFERKHQYGSNSNEICTYRSYGDYYLF